MFKLIRQAGCWLIIFFLTWGVFAQDSNWQVLKSTHFYIYYKQADQSVLNELAERAEEYYDSIAKGLGFNRFNFWTWDNRAKIYLFDQQQDYQAATQSSGWSAGQVRINNKLIQSYIGAPGFLHNILPHELAHIIFMEMVGFNNPAIPLWLQEGVATFHEKEIYSAKARLAQHIQQDNYIKLSDLSRFDLKRADDQQVELFYLESYSLVKYLITEFGTENFVLFCQYLRDKRNLMSALTRVYAFKNLDDFEISWKQYILK